MRTHQVLLVGDFLHGFARGVFAGIGAFAQQAGDWRITVHNARVLDGPIHPPPDGLVIQLTDLASADMIKRMGVPAVSVANRLEEPAIHHVGVNDLAVGALAAEHFLERGYRALAYVGDPSIRYQRLRLAGFCEHLTRHDATLDVLELPTPWQPNRDRVLDEVLARREEPLAVLAANDGLAVDLMQALDQRGVRVPDEVAVMGVDDDPFLVNRVRVSLSSIVLPLDAIGRLAAATLARLMQGQTEVPREQLLPPLDVQIRASSGLHATSDPLVRAALACIAHHYADPDLDVSRVAAEVHASRRALEVHFSREVRRGVAAHIAHTRIRQACHLLDHTDLPVKQIAHRVGYRSPMQFCVAFRKAMGTTALDYRQRIRRAVSGPGW